MKKILILLLMLGASCIYSNNQIAYATTYEDEVQIYFERNTSESSKGNEDSKDKEFIEEIPNKNNGSKLPQLGQLISSVIVLLIGTVLVLVIIMIYLVRKINELKKIGGE